MDYLYGSFFDVNLSFFKKIFLRFKIKLNQEIPKKECSQKKKKSKFWHHLLNLILFQTWKTFFSSVEHIFNVLFCF